VSPVSDQDTVEVRRKIPTAASNQARHLIHGQSVTLWTGLLQSTLYVCHLYINIVLTPV